MSDSRLHVKSGSRALTRRTFLGNAATASMAIASMPIAAHGAPTEGSRSSFLNLLRDPDLVTAYSGLESSIPLTRFANHWRARGVDVEISPQNTELPIRISSPGEPLTHVHLRWRESVSSSLLCLGDAWERSYGDLAWRSLVPERPMPWYCVTFDGTTTHGYGVRTGARALCFWQIDNEGVSLWLDIGNGGSGVQLGERRLEAATVVAYEGASGENSVDAVRHLCKRMCAAPRPSTGPIYGSNDWYYAYGNSSRELILQDADLVASLRPKNAPKPFTVIDEGQANTTDSSDMTQLAAEIRRREVRPGVWLRPLRVPAGVHPGLLLPAGRFGERTSRAAEQAFDPTIPDALQLVSERVQNIRSWGYELLKHDFSTYDLLGQWGFEMGPRPTLPGWTFHDRSRTNAEIILDLYRAIRLAAGEKMLILGCNTIGHLAAGIFDIQRTGDDTSGKLWERTRRMGINTLAFRLPQHHSFFTLDSDCVAVTQAVSWELTRQWLDLVARSGTALFVSAERGATGSGQRSAIREAFALATSAGPSATPKDWLRNTTPERWIETPAKREKQYQWCAPDGAYPFTV